MKNFNDSESDSKKKNYASEVLKRKQDNSLIPRNNVSAYSDKILTVGKKRRCKNCGKGLKRKLLAVAAAVVAIYLIAAVAATVIGGLTTTTALNGVLTEGFRTDGYIFREQTVITAPCTGHFECMVGDGDRVSVGQIIGYIYSAQPSADTVKRLKELNIRLAEAGIYGKEEAYTSGGYASSSDTASYIRGMSDIRTQRNLKSFSEKSAGLASQIKSETENYEDGKTTEELSSEIASLNASAGLLQTITAEKGGVFCPRTDGMEDKLDYSKAIEATPAYLNELDATEPVISQSVEAGQPLCKIINNYNWYFAANVDKEQAESVKVGQSIEMEFFDLSDTSISGKVAAVSAEEGGKVTVVVSTNRYVNGIYSTNRINCDIVTVSVSGIKLPVSCLRVKDGTEGVFVVRLDRAKFVPVNVKYKNDEWAIVNPIDSTGDGKLKIYDEVIADAKSVEDEKIVR